MNKNTSLYHLLLDLVNKKEKSRSKVASSFSNSSEEARKEAILQGIHAKDAKVRSHTYAVIGEMRDSSFTKEIMKGLKDRNASVVQMAVWCIGRLQWNEGLPSLVQLLDRNVGFQVMKTIVWSMGEIGDSSVLPDLCRLLEDGSTRLIEGILVAGMKMGDKFFLELLQSLDCENQSVQKAIQDITYASQQVRSAIIRPLLHTQNPQTLGNLLPVLPHVSLHEQDYPRLLQADHELIRLATYQSISQSPLPWRTKQSLFISALEDKSNRVVRLSLTCLVDYMQNSMVQEKMNKVSNHHPSPKIRELSMNLLNQFQLFQTMKKHAARWNRFLLETLPGIESYLEQEAAHMFGLSFDVTAKGNGWVEVTFREEDNSIDDIKRMYTVSSIYGILSITKEGEDEVVNPYVISEMNEIREHPNEEIQLFPLQEVRVNESVYRCIPVVEETQMIRPARTLRSTSLDWRVSRAIVIASNPTTKDVFIDPTCGSGTILMDRAVFAPYAKLIGGDKDSEAVRVSKGNLEPYANVEISQWDAERLPLEDRSVTVVVSNLPFGRRVGDHEKNVSFYPTFLKEVIRLLKPGGRAVLFTQEVSLLKETIQSLANQVDIVSEQPIEMGGLNPHIISIKKLSQ